MSDLSISPSVAATETIAVRVAGLWARSRSWVAKGTLAVLDQGLISGSNFLISVLLARWLGADQYGAYALAFSIFLLFLIAYQALVLEPMCVFGPSQYQECEMEYLGTLLRMHGMFTGATVVIMLISALAVWKLSLPHSLIGALHGVMVAAPCVLLFWLVRRAFYMQLLPGQSVIGAALYCVILAGGLWFLNKEGLLSPFTAFLLMGLGALATSILLFLRLRPPLRSTPASPRLGPVSREHWNYGRWALASAAVAWIPWNISYILVSSFHGMAATGDLKALLNLALPMRQSYAAFSLLFIPYASRVTQQGGSSGVRDLSRRITLLFAAGSVAYWAFFTFFKKEAMHFLYGGNYSGVIYLIPWIALISIVTGAIQGRTIVLRGMQSPASVFANDCFASGVCLVVGIPVIWKFGVRGAVGAILLSSLTGLVGSSFLLRRGLQKRTSNDPSR